MKIKERGFFFFFKSPILKGSIPDVQKKQFIYCTKNFCRSHAHKILKRAKEVVTLNVT